MIIENSFDNTNLSLIIFPLLSYVTEESPRFINVNINPMLVLVTNTSIPIAWMQFFSRLPKNQEIVSLRLLALKDGSAFGETVYLNNTSQSAQTKPPSHRKIPAVIPTLTIKTDQNKVPSIFKNFYSDLNDVSISDKNNVRK